MSIKSMIYMHNLQQRLDLLTNILKIEKRQYFSKRKTHKENAIRLLQWYHKDVLKLLGVLHTIIIYEKSKIFFQIYFTDVNNLLYL